MITKLTFTEFCDKVFDLKTPQAMRFKGLIPAIVLFYVGKEDGWIKPMWSGLEELSDSFYSGRINFYAVNFDEDIEVAAALQFGALPVLMLFGLNDQGSIAPGLVTDKAILEAIITKAIPLSNSGVPNASKLILAR